MDLLEWLELGDIEKRNFRNRTWIPLLSSQQHLSEKEFGYAGYRKDAELIETVVIFLQYQQTSEKLGWHGVQKSGTDRAWTDGRTFHAPGAFYWNDDNLPIGFYP